jgi:hypothetical protein
MNVRPITSLDKYARITGALYLIIIICGMSSEMFVRAVLIDWNDPDATVANIAANPMLFRLGFISDLIMVMSDVAVALTFYVLLKHVSNAMALMAALFRLVQSAILGMNLLNYFQPIILLENNGKGLDPEQVNALVMQHLFAHDYGYLVALVFFALSCIVLGYLLYKSPLFPGILGVLLIIAAGGYLIDSFTNFLFPAHAPLTEWLVVVSALVGEVGLCFWLLIKGVKKDVDASAY